MAANLTAKVLGAQGDKFKDFFDDPNKLLQMILAAESSRGPGGGGGSGPGFGGSVAAAVELRPGTLWDAGAGGAGAAAVSGGGNGGFYSVVRRRIGGGVGVGVAGVAEPVVRASAGGARQMADVLPHGSIRRRQAAIRVRRQLAHERSGICSAADEADAAPAVGQGGSR